MAKSDLSVAQVGKLTDDTKYETLCTQCQQAAEKALKALLILKVGITCPLMTKHIPTLWERPRQLYYGSNNKFRRNDTFGTGIVIAK
ncbi:MAG: HEPN domain-containing protein [Methanoregulaceae archaeon]